MSGYHPQKGLVNRYWKRPKPHIYECNMRDAERFYKDSYNQYLQTKHFTSANRSKPTGIEEEFATKWTLNRMNSRIDAQHNPLRKEGSVTGYSGEYDVSDRDSRSRVTFSRHDSLIENGGEPRPSYRSSSLVQPAREASPISQLDNVESRLERIRKLREELGLKSDGTLEDSSSTSAPSRSCLRKSAQDTSSETIGQKNETYQNSYGRTNNRSQGNDSTNDTYESRHTQRSERPPRAARNGGTDNSYSSSYNTNSEKGSYKSYVSDDGDKYSASSRDSKYQNYDKYSSSSNTKSSKYSDGDYNFDSKPSASHRNKDSKYNNDSFSYESKPPRGAKLSTASSNDDDYSKYDGDDDELVSNLRKKFPTSDEILERIKKIDSDL